MTLRIVILPSIALLALLNVNISAANETLPEPLTLEAALNTASVNHPSVGQAMANTDLAAAALERAKAGDDIRLNLSIQARSIHSPEPPNSASYQSRDDSRAVLRLQKTLYDFGRTFHASEASAQSLTSSQHLLALAKLEQSTTIMKRYFEVILADLESARATEAMSIAFVTLANATERHALGELSDVDLLELENTYQIELQARNRADNAPRFSRARLALAMNRPGELPSNLEEPELPGLENPLPDYDTLLAEAREKNLGLSALNKERQASLDRQAAAKAERLPRLSLGLEAAQYQQEFGARGPFTVILGLDIPLYQGGRIDAETDTKRAMTRQTRARLLAAEYRLNEQLLDTWQTIMSLTQQLKQAETQSEFREIYLDRSRANYELEIKTDLGDAMVAQTQARHFAAKTRFDLALARERLSILTHNPQYSALYAASRPPASEEQP